MKRRMTTALFLIFLALPLANIASAQQANSPEAEADKTVADQSAGPYEQAQKLYQQGQYDQAIKLLEGPSAGAPYDLKVNALMARAILSKCEELKKSKDKNYRYYIKRPYVIGIRLLKAHPSLPEPYYLAAKSLLINNRPNKAAKFMKKAIYFAGPQHESYPEYMMTQGDCWTALMIKGDMRGFGYAKKSYQQALAAAKGNAAFAAQINARLQYLEEKYKRK